MQLTGTTNGLKPQSRLTYHLKDKVRLSTVLVLLATGSGYLAGTHRLFELTCHFRVQYLVASALCFAGLLLLRDWRWSMAAAAAAALNGLEVLPWYLPDRARSEVTSQPLRVVLCNVLTRNPNSEAVLALARQEAPDVLVLQEVDQRWATELAELDHALPYSRKVVRPDNFGIGLWSRYPLSNVQEIESGEYGIPSIQAQLEVNGHRIAVLATHPLPPANARGFAERNAQLSALATIARESSIPVVLIGDLNVTMWSPYYRKLVRDSGLRNARKGFGIIPTWPCGIPMMSIPLDHCLTSPSLQVNAIKRGKQVGSDHFPIIVDLAVTGVAAASKGVEYRIARRQAKLQE